MKNKNITILIFTIVFVLINHGLGSADYSFYNDGNSESYKYEIKPTTFNENNIKIHYPLLINVNDENKQSTINSIIKNEALKGLNYYPAESRDGLTLDIDYKITYQSDNLISIIYSGIGMIEGAAHPNHLFYTTNIDLERGSKFKLKDMIDIDEKFIEKFKDRSVAKNRIHEGLLNKFETKDLLKMLINADSLNTIGTELQFDTYSYLTKDSLGISIGVSHALGGHAEFELPYEYITKDNIADTWNH